MVRECVVAPERNPHHVGDVMWEKPGSRYTQTEGRRSNLILSPQVYISRKDLAPSPTCELFLMHFHHFYWRELDLRNSLTTQLSLYLCTAIMQMSLWLVVQLSGVSSVSKLKMSANKTKGWWPFNSRSLTILWTATMTWRRESLIWKQLRITRRHYTTPLWGICNLLLS